MCIFYYLNSSFALTMVKLLPKIPIKRSNIINMNSETFDDKNLDGNGDIIFDPPAELIIHDYDDERTIEEEEALESNEDPQTELSNLQREGEMPLSELLALYGYGENDNDNDDGNGDNDDDDNNSSDDLVSNHDTSINKDFKDHSVHLNNVLLEENNETEIIEEEPSELFKLYEEIPEGTTVNESGGTCRLLRSVSRPQSEEEEDDCDYSPDEEEWKKTIMVGSDYQAKIPVSLCKYDDALPYENDDKILWDPSELNEKQIEEFLIKATDSLNKNSSIHVANNVKDDEQALYLLLQCGYNADEALRRLRLNSMTPAHTMSIWSEDECRNFEIGMKLYGKDFHAIQKNKVRTRSVGELVQFYYLWKKTERHDIYAHKSRLEKKKYSLHPGITDYMDRFLEEQEVGSGHQDRSSSPNLYLLLYSDSKKHGRIEKSEQTSSEVDPLGNLFGHLRKENLNNFVKLNAMPESDEVGNLDVKTQNTECKVDRNSTPLVITLEEEEFNEAIKD